MNDLFFLLNFVIVFSVGFLCGFIARKDDIKVIQERLQRQFTQKQQLTPGVIPRPSAQEIARRQLPTKEREAQNEMRKTFAAMDTAIKKP